MQPETAAAVRTVCEQYKPASATRKAVSYRQLSLAQLCRSDVARSSSLRDVWSEPAADESPCELLIGWLGTVGDDELIGTGSRILSMPLGALKLSEAPPAPRSPPWKPQQRRWRQQRQS